MEPSMFQKLLLRRVQETYGSSIPPIIQLVNGLRAKYPEYRRHKPQLFTRWLQQTLNSVQDKGKRKLEDLPSLPPIKKAKARRPTSASDSLDSSSSDSDSSDSSSSDPDSLDSSSSSSSSDPESFDSSSSDYSSSSDSNSSEGLTSEDECYSQPKFDPTKSLNCLPNDVDGPWFKDFGGIDDVLIELKNKLILPLYNPQVSCNYPGSLMAGILLHGPPGCGKTKLAHAIANESGLPFYEISATELVSGVLGGSEENIRELFSKAYKTAPSIVFIDEIDAIASKRENLGREMKRRIVTQLITCMGDRKRAYVLVIGATNRPDAIDPTLRRPGRFDHEFRLGVPDENARRKILSAITQNIKLEGAFDLVKVAKSTPGFVGADLEALVKEAGGIAMQRIFERKLEHSRKNEGWWRKGYCWTHEEIAM
ncbi:putative AAA+ ATPase domain, ATPase, AAA-type, core, AAA ATPase, AAA+ lid domain-containing protein [Helianthus anomalus]